MSARPSTSAHDADVLSLEPLGATFYLEFDRLPFREAAETVGHDRGVMTENVFAALLFDETEFFRVIEPLDYARCYIRLPRPSSGPGRCHAGATLRERRWS